MRKQANQQSANTFAVLHMQDYLTMKQIDIPTMKPQKHGVLCGLASVCFFFFFRIRPRLDFSWFSYRLRNYSFNREGFRVPGVC